MMSKLTISLYRTYEYARSKVEPIKRFDSTNSMQAFGIQMPHWYIVSPGILTNNKHTSCYERRWRRDRI